MENLWKLRLNGLRPSQLINYLQGPTFLDGLSRDWRTLRQGSTLSFTGPLWLSKQLPSQPRFQPFFALAGYWLWHTSTAKMMSCFEQPYLEEALTSPESRKLSDLAWTLSHVSFESYIHDRRAKCASLVENDRISLYPIYRVSGKEDVFVTTFVCQSYVDFLP